MIPDWISLEQLSYIFGIIGTTYGIKKKRELTQYKIKSERARTSAYRAKKKAEDAKRTKHTVETLKIVWDTITGKKKSDAGEFA
jgi:hypothetical protein